MNRGGLPLQDLKAAEEDYTEALKLSGESAALHASRGAARFRRAKCLEEMRDLPAARSFYARALEDFREAIRLDPSYEKSLQSGPMGEAEQRLSGLRSP